MLSRRKDSLKKLKNPESCTRPVLLINFPNLCVIILVQNGEIMSNDARIYTHAKIKLVITSLCGVSLPFE